MASAYSILHNYRQETYGPNLQLMGAALQYKQDALNANRQKLRSIYNQVDFLDMAKGVDKEHAEKRLGQAKDIINSFSSADLTNNSLVDSLIGKMDEVIDDDIKTAVLSTKRYRAEQAEWEKARQANDGSYDERNHRAAMQNANAWLADEEVGKGYSGGGGFNPYIDVQAKINKGLPDALKAKGIESKRLADGSIYFRNVITGVEVTKSDVAEAINTLIDDKDRKQLSINAWAKYDNMPDEYLKEKFQNHYEPMVDEIDDRLSKLQTKLDSAEDGSAKKASLEAEMAALNRTKQSYEENDYDAIVSKAGKSGAYNVLYTDEFMSPFKNTYSVNKITDIQTYDNDVKTRNHKIALDENDRANRKQALDEAKFHAEQAEKRANDTSSYGPNRQQPLSGEKVELPYDEEKPAVQRWRDEKFGFIKDVKGLFGINDPIQMRNLKSQVFDKGFKGKKSIEYNGKEVMLIDDNGNVTEAFNQLLRYETNIINKSPEEIKAAKALNAELDEGLWVLAKVAQEEDPDIDFDNEFVRYNFKFEKDPETGLMKKVAIDGNKINNYADLIRKKGDKNASLTDAENLTLKTYYRMHLLGDPKLDYDSKQMLLDDMKTNLFKRLDDDTYRSFPQGVNSYGQILKSSSGDISASRVKLSSTKLKESDFYKKNKDKMRISRGANSVGDSDLKKTPYAEDLSKLNDYYLALEEEKDEVKKKSIRKKIRSQQKTIEKQINLVTSRPGETYDDYYLSDLDSGDTEISNPNSFYDTKFKSIEQRIEDGKKVYNEKLEQSYKSKYDDVTITKKIFNADTPGHSGLLTKLGLKKGDKRPITVWREWNEAEEDFTGKVHWSYKQGTDASGYEVISSEEDGNNKLDQQELLEEGIVAFGTRVNTYKATDGEAAPTFSLGTGVDEAVTMAHLKRDGNDVYQMSNKNLDELIMVSKNIDQETVDQVRTLSKSFFNKEFEFKVEPSNGYWKYAMYKDGKKVPGSEILTEQGGRQSYSENDISMLYSDSERVMNHVMYDYLFRMVEERAKEKDYQITQEERELILK